MSIEIATSTNIEKITSLVTKMNKIVMKRNDLGTTKMTIVAGLKNSMLVSTGNLVMIQVATTKDRVSLVAIMGITITNFQTTRAVGTDYGYIDDGSDDDVEVIESSADEKDESSFKQESRCHHEIIVNDDEAEARRKSDESNRGTDIEENDVVRIENGDISKDLVENEIEDRSRQLESKYVDERASDEEKTACFKKTPLLTKHLLKLWKTPIVIKW